MKNLLHMPRAFLLAAFALLGAGTLQAANFFDNSIAGYSLGNASGGANIGGNGHKNWAIFAMSGGVTITDTGLDGSYDVLGNVGIVGSGALTMSASKIQGSVYRDSGNYTPSGSPVITGTNTTGNGGYLTTGFNNANAASAGWGALTTNQLGAPGDLTFGGAFAGVAPGTIALNNTAASITDNTAGSTYVLNLTDLILAGTSAVLTLNGTSSTNYVINVNQYMTLSSKAQIALGNGGIGANNVLFNVQNTTPAYDVTLSGAAVVNGIILAPTRNVKLTGGSVVYGEVIGKGVSLSGRSKVINPFVSP